MEKRKATEQNSSIIAFLCTNFHEHLALSMTYLLAGNKKKLADQHHTWYQVSLLSLAVSLFTLYMVGRPRLFLSGSYVIS